MLVAEKRLDHEQFEEKVLIEKPSRRKRPRNLKSRKTFKSRMYFIAFAIITTLACLSLLFRYVAITEMNAQIRLIRNEQRELTKERDYLLTELESARSSSNIEEQARLHLGMDYPNTDQIVYVNVEKPDLQLANEENDVFIIKHIKNIFDVIISFF